MATRVQLIRHPTAEANVFTGKEGEVTVDLDNDELRVHDGVKAGGHGQARKDLANVVEATTSQDGKMTAARIIELVAATAGLAAEVLARTNADAQLELDYIAAILVETNNRIADVDTEEAARIAADAVLQADINTRLLASAAYVHPNHTGDVTSVGDGAQTIVNDAVSNAKLANMGQATVKGRASGAGTGDPVDLSAAQVRTIINVEDGATADQTAAEIKTAYESNANTNAFTDAEQTKLAGIDTAAIAQTDTPQEWTGQQNFDEATLTDGAAISWDLNTAQCATVTLGGSRTLLNPTNMKAGSSYILRVKQDAIGGRALTYDTAYKSEYGLGLLLSTDPLAVDLLIFYSDGVSMFGTILRDLQ